VLGIYIMHHGAEIYLLVITGCFLLLLLLRASPTLFGNTSTRQSVAVALAAALAFCTAEILVDLVGTTKGQQPIISVVLILAYAAGLLLSIRARPKTEVRSNGRKPMLEDEPFNDEALTSD
jgi:hypothetical protein